MCFPFSRLAFFVALAFCNLLALPTHAQLTVEGDIYYYTDEATIETDIRGNDVVVGRNPDGNFSAIGDTDILTPYTVTVADGAQITRNGTFADGYFALGLFSNSAVNMTGGSVDRVLTNDNSTLSIAGGTVAFARAQVTSTLNITSGVVNQADSFATSVANISGGTVNQLSSAGSSTLNITGGTVNDLRGFDSGKVNLFGGTIGTEPIRFRGDSILSIYGSDLSSALIGTGSDPAGGYTAYRLSGTLQNGQSLDGITFYDLDGGSEVQDPFGQTGNLRFFSTAAAPEPGTLSIAAVAVLGLAAYRSHRAKKPTGR